MCYQAIDNLGIMFSERWVKGGHDSYHNIRVESTRRRQLELLHNKKIVFLLKIR